MVNLSSFAEKEARKSQKLPAFKEFNIEPVKEKVALILDMIGKDTGIFSTYTLHNISHVDKMLKILEWLIPPDTKKILTPVEWLLISLSIYLHDLGMVVTKREYDERLKDDNFKDFMSKLDKTVDGRDYLARTERMTEDEKERFFYQEFIRLGHADRIETWIKGKGMHNENKLGPIIIEINKMLEPLPTRFINNVAYVCGSHHKDNIDNIDYYPICEKYGDDPKEVANIQYAAVVLRTADLLHITKDRTPSVIFKLLELSDPKAVDEWKKQMGTFSVHQKGREFDKNNEDTHVIVFKADFTEEKSFFALTEYLAYADKQIKQSKRWIDESRKYPDAKEYHFPWHSIERDIRVENNEPITFKFELDKRKLLNLLVGHTIYNDPTVAIRELIQNSIDAVRFKEYFAKNKNSKDIEFKSGSGKVIIKWNSKNRELIVEDNGIGMGLDVIKHHLMCVGASYYDTPQFHTEYKDFTAISKFGVGILTCFMVSDDIEIITCKENKGYRIKMSSVHGTYLLRVMDANDVVLHDINKGGTIVKLRFRSSIDLKDRSILDIVRYWIILPECDIEFVEDNKEPIKIGHKTIEDAIKFYGSEKSEIKPENIEIICFDESGANNEQYKLAFPVYRGNTPEKRFLTLHSVMPAVCIEGIRADYNQPGFSRIYGLGGILSVRDDKSFKTTVSRMSLEVDDNYWRVGYLCCDLYFKHIKNEVERIKNLSGRPLSRASTAGRWLYHDLLKATEDECHKYVINTLKPKLPQIVMENVDNANIKIVTSRELLTSEDLSKYDIFWTIESRFVDNLSIISRDMGKELSINEFITKLAPEMRNDEINPIIIDAHTIAKILLETNEITEVRFSKKEQQTLFKWEKLNFKQDKVINIRNIHEILMSNLDELSKTFPVYLKEYNLLDFERRGVLIDMCDSILDLDIVTRLSGDISEIVGVKSRIMMIIKDKCELATIYNNILKAIYSLIKLKKRESVILLFAVSLIISGLRKSSWYGTPLYYGDEGGKTNELWRIFVPEFNRALKNADIDLNLKDNIYDIIGKDEYWFDAQSYWLDWDKRVE